jgi:NAD+ synthase (glutamine-hydrolysing)
MKLIKVAAAALNQTPLDWRGNLARVHAAIAQARAQSAPALCLPELCLSGYGCEDTFLSPNTLRQALRLLHEVCPATRGMVVSLGLPVMVDNGIFNVAALLVDGRLHGFVAKQHLAGDGIHYEPRWFKPWPAGVRDALKFDGEPVPVGDLYFDVGGIRLGFEICEDAWAARPGIQPRPQGRRPDLQPQRQSLRLARLACASGSCWKDPGPSAAATPTRTC